MNNFWSRLNSSERRFVGFVGLLFFVVINLFFVWPHFSDWSNTKSRMESARRKLGMFEQQITKTPALEKELGKLQAQGLDVPAEDQAIGLLRTVTVQAGQSGVGFLSNARTSTSTNQFFLEQIITVNVLGDEKQLVDFLYNLSAGNSLITVRDLNVTPDPPRQKLNANITLVASYQKKTPAKPVAKPAASTPKPKPAPAPVAKPAPAPGKPAVAPNKPPASLVPKTAKQPATPTKK